MLTNTLFILGYGNNDEYIYINSNKNYIVLIYL